VKKSYIENLFFTGIKKVFVILLFISISPTQQCSTKKISRELTQVENAKELNPKREYLKVHMNTGELYILHNWKINDATKIIHGIGTHLDANRRIIASSLVDKDTNQLATQPELSFNLPYEDILIIETNNKSNNPGVATMILTSVFTVPLAIACIIEPKSCFGSCPTFFVQNLDNEMLVAEGFSSSISRSMEEIDVDIVDFPDVPGPMEITMKNEALETHMVRSINLLVCDREPGNSVFQASDGKFYEVGNISAPEKALYNSESIVDKVSFRDETEWFSLADSINLATKEEVFLEFENFSGLNGLVLDKRQSLMTTYLFYQMLAYTGMATSYLISEMETRKPNYKNRINKMYELLGGIEVAVKDEKGKWIEVGNIKESGPIASDMHLVKLPINKSTKLHVRLRLTKGLWRINMVNLASIKGEAIPKRIYPEKVYSAGSLDSLILIKLLDKDQYLVTYPGDEYRISFPLESLPSQQYFLESQGYYIEWMREEWLKEENITIVKKAMLFPASYLKKTAPYFKIHETEMESIFWNSKYPKIEIQ
jgi:hypothetical protein